VKSESAMITDDLEEKEANVEPDENSMDHMKKVDSMEEFNNLQKLQSRILQKLIEKIDHTENNNKSNNK
jgi:hypothetical protein